MIEVELPIEVRAATPADLAEIQAVAERTWRATYAGKIPDQQITLFLDRAYNLDALRRTLEHICAGMLVAAAGETIVGYAMAGSNRASDGELFAIYVLPGSQGLGAGRLLWQHETDHLRRLGFSEMILWVLDANDRARRFYERQGAGAYAERDFPIGVVTIKEVGYRVRLE